MVVVVWRWVVVGGGGGGGVGIPGSQHSTTLDGDEDDYDDDEYNDDYYDEDIFSLQDFQLALDLFLQPYTSLARYVTLAILQAADVDGDGGLGLEELSNFRSEVFFAETKKVISQIYSR